MITKLSTYFYSFSAFLIGTSIVVVLYLGLPLGIDFTGGSELEIRGTQDVALVEEVFAEHSLTPRIQTSKIQATGETSLIIRFPEISEEMRQAIVQDLTRRNESITQDRFESIGPVIGNETQEKSIIAVALVLCAILVYVAFAFRKLSYPISSWKYGVVALIALFHDILITVGVVALIAHFTDRDLGVPFIAALLTVLGYSVNDTIVIFDRIRENFLNSTKAYRNFRSVVDKSVRETLVRSLNSSLTTICVLVAILVFGGESMFIFMATLIIGISVGTYSSIALASPLLASLAHREQKMK
ncbi:MAG: protein translocase subunit SecF [Candidatus Spechtbacteria bacterium SB0662_bin_43]|uniref:Protein-export membrane protein SecF n=1 Tax=Candidatus Spechtbacteria bacterium SB0662_bin_43 TaxID=2604897 RepID=A0A845DM16_9BACT|nr:protein translocase subunit SecF [Candidatus Spechtbacteria bacterium SB0662_bin_43]